MEMEEKNFETEETQDDILRGYTVLEALEQTMAMAGTAMEKYLEEERGEPMKSAFVIDTKKNMDRAYVGIWHKLSEEKPEESGDYLCLYTDYEHDILWHRVLRYVSADDEDLWYHKKDAWYNDESIVVDELPLYWSELPVIPNEIEGDYILGGNS